MVVADYWRLLKDLLVDKLTNCCIIVCAQIHVVRKHTRVRARVRTRVYALAVMHAQCVSLMLSDVLIEFLITDSLSACMPIRWKPTTITKYLSDVLAIAQIN